MGLQLPAKAVIALQWPAAIRNVARRLH